MTSTQVINTALIGGPESILIDAARLAIASQAAITFYNVPHIQDSPPLDVNSAPPAFASAFRHILAQDSLTRDALIVETLHLLEESNLLFPAELLSELTTINKTATHTQKRDFVQRLSRVIGARGRWIIDITQPGFFDAALVQPTLADWESDSLQRRIAFLVDLHASAPARARELLASALHERDKNREHYIGALRESLSAEDEPVLMLAVTDRKQSVRKAAAELLAHLDRSAYIDRAVEMARECFRDALKYPGSLTVHPPEAPSRKTDPLGWAMLEDAPRSFERIREVVELIPPHRLGEIGLQIEDLALEAIIEGHPINLGTAFATSIIRWKDLDAARALLKLLPHGELAVLLPEKEMNKALVSYLTSRNFGEVLRALKALLTYPDRPLGPDISRTMMTYLEHPGEKGYSYYFPSLALFLATHSDISISEEIGNRLSTALQEGSRAEQVLTILHIRQQIHQSLISVRSAQNVSVDSSSSR